MTIDSFIRRLDHTFSWLYYKHQWAEWELLVLAIIAMFLLLWVLKRQKNTAARSTNFDQTSQRPPIIGAKLADHHRNQRVIEDAKERHSDLIAQFSGKKKRKLAGKHIENLNGQITQLHIAINKYKEMEERFIEKITELTADNEKLRDEVEKYKQQDQLASQQTNESAFIDNSQEQELGENEPIAAEIDHEQVASQPQQIVEPVKLEVMDSPSAAEYGYETSQHHKRMVMEKRQNDETSQEEIQKPKPLKRDDDPLDIQKLKAIAALARQIQGYPRHG